MRFAPPEKIARLRELAAKGMTAAEIAEAMGMYNGSGVHRLAKKYAITICDGRRAVAVSSPEVRAKRIANMRKGMASIFARSAALDERIIEAFHKMRPSGARLVDIGGAVGCSRERVAKCIRKAGLSEMYQPPKRERKSDKAPGSILTQMGRPHRQPREAMPIITQAAQYLGRHYPKVYRADLHDNPFVFPKGRPEAYVLGNRVVPVEAMMAEAQALGFGR